MTDTPTPPAGGPKPRIVRCPQCGGDSVYGPDNPWRPFCSRACRSLDLGAWASEDYRVAAQPDPTDDPDELPPAAH